MSRSAVRQLAGALFVAGHLLIFPLAAIAAPEELDALQALGAIMGQQRELPIEVRLNEKQVLSSSVVRVNDGLAIPYDTQVAGRLPLKAPPFIFDGGPHILLKDISLADFTYEPEAARLEINIQTGDLLPQTFYPRHTALPPMPAEPALITNYDWLLTRNSYGSSSSSAVGLNIEHVLSFGALRFNQSWAYAKSRGLTGLGASGAPSAWRRIDSFAQFDQPEQARTWVMGDQTTSPPGLARPVRSFGLTLRRNFESRPEMSTQPRPSLSGYTVQPSTYELYVDSFKRGAGSLEEGRFDFASAVDGMASGEVRVVMTDALGRETVVIAPFFFSAAQLGADVSDYMVHIGKQRNALSGQRADYGETLMQAEYGRGISDAWTLRGSAEATKSLNVLSLRSAHSLWGRAALLVDAAGSRSNEMGSGRMLNLQLNGRWESLFWGASTTRRTAAFLQIGDTQDGQGVQRKEQTSLSIGLRPSQGSSLSLLATRERRFDGSKLTTWRPSFSYSLTRFQRLSLTASFLNDKGDINRSVFLGWTYRTAASDHLAQVTINTNNGQRSATASVERPFDLSSPMRYRVAASQDNGLFSQTASEGFWGYRGESVETELGVQARSSNGSHSLLLESQGTGTLVAVSAGVFASSRARDSAVLVKVGDMNGVRVSDSATTTSTNSAGWALLPSAMGFLRNRFVIEGSDIPIEADFQGEPVEVVPWPKSVVLINTKVEQIEGSSWIIQQGGAPAPLATRVVISDGETAFVGKGGALYLPFDAVGKSVKATLPSGLACVISFPRRPDAASRAEPLLARCE